MYIVKIINGENIYEIHGIKEKLKTGSIVKGINAIDSFSFNVLPSNKYFNSIKDLQTMVSVYNTNKDRYEFYGRVLYSSVTMDENGLISKTAICESYLGFLCDSVQYYVAEKNWTVMELLSHIVDIHNSQVESHKQFRIGNVNVTDPNDNLYVGIQIENSWKTLQDKLIEKLGGEISFRVEGGIIYLDYLVQIGSEMENPIKLSKNMKAITREDNPLDYISRLIPYGCKLKDEDGNETEERLDITSVNNGRNYIENAEAVAAFGIRYGTVTFDDVTVASNLLSKGIEHLEECSRVQVKYSVEALDLSLLGLDIGDFDVGNYHPVINPLLGIDDNVRIIKKTIDICEEVKSSIEIGDNFKTASDIAIEQAGKINGVFQEVETIKVATNNLKEISSLAYEIATAAEGRANNAVNDAAIAQAAADEAARLATTAQESAIDAQTAANKAQTAINVVEGNIVTIEKNIETAQAAAETAQAAAETADAKAVEAARAAGKAQNKADEAAAAVIVAQETADTAVTNAATAQETANTAKGIAESATAAAAEIRQDVQAAEDEIANLHTSLETLSNTMQTDYVRDTDLSTVQADLQTQISQNAAQIQSTATKVTEVDETSKQAAADAKALAEAAQKTADEAQAQANQATSDAAAAQSAADLAAQAATAAQSEADKAKAAAAAADTKAQEAADNLATAEQNLADVTSRVDSTEEEIEAAERAVVAAQAAADKANEDAQAAADKADSAQVTADTAVINAGLAQDTADSAAAAAQTAQEQATAAGSAAQAAQATADAAASAASNAQETADTAKTNAQNAQNKANDAAAAAAAAQTAADEADAKAAQAATDLETAKANLEAVTGRVDATEEEIEAAQQAVETAQAAADQAKTNAAAAQSTADTAKADAAKAQTAADNAKTAADQAQADADAAKDAADKAQADVDSLAVRVTTAETNITQNAEQIALMATKTEVAETLGGYTTKSEMEAALTVQADEINLSVSTNYATKSALAETDANVANHAETLEDHESRISVNENAISMKVSSTEFSSYQTTVTNNIAAAKSEAISTAANDATTKANNAKTSAISTASSDATSKANAAKEAAITAAASDATSKANAAKESAISTAASDATSKANAAKSAAISAAATDATNKANAALTSANEHTDLLNKVETLASNMKLFKNVCSLTKDSANQKGYIIITTPITPSRMVSVKVKGYNYVNENETIDLTIGFYNYSSSMPSTGFVNNGSFKVTNVQVGKVSSSDTRAVIIIGESTTTWQYPKIVVEEVLVGYGTVAPDSYKDGFSIEMTTTLPTTYAHLTTLKGSDFKTEITTTKTTVAEHTTSLNSISSRVSSTESSITTINGEIDSLETRMNAAELKITDSAIIATVSGTYATKTALSATDTKAANAATAAANAQADIDNLDIGGRNYIVLSKLSSYTPYNSVPTASGNVITTTRNTSATGNKYLTLQISGYTPPNEFMTLSGYIKVNGSIPTTDFFTTIPSTYGSNEINRVYDPTTGYFEYTQKYPGNSGWIIHGQVNVTPGNADVITFTNLKFEKGTRATDWTPAPEDMATEADLTAAETRITQTEKSITSQASTISEHGSKISTLEQTAEGFTISLQTTNSNVTAAANAASAAQSTANSAASAASTAQTTANSVKTDLANNYAKKTIPDTRNDNQTPEWYITNYPKQIVTEFKYCSKIGLSASETYCALETTVPWSDSSGGYPKQLAKVGSKHYWRIGTSATAWGAWQDALGDAADAASAASAAQSTANSASTAASNAQTTANTANSTANAAKTAAATAQSTADTALSQSIEYIVGTQTAATNAWTGKTTDTALYVGKTIAYKLPYAGNSSAATLNLTLAGGGTTGAKGIRRLNSTVTTNYVAESIVHMTYDGTYWRITDYNSDTYDRVRYNKAIKCGTTAIVAANIIVGTGGLYKHLKAGTAFDVSYPILYAASAISASGTGTNNYLCYSFTVTTTQSITLTAYKPVYIKGTLSGTTFTPVSTAPLTQTVPTSNDGYYYILLGHAITSTTMYLTLEHPIYTYFNGSFKAVSQIAVEAAKTATNYMNFSSEGLVVGDMTASTLGNNVLIRADGIDIRSGTTVKATFDDDYIALGVDAYTAEIRFLNGAGKILADSVDDTEFFDRMYVMSHELILRGGTARLESSTQYENTSQSYSNSAHSGVDVTSDGDGSTGTASVGIRAAQEYKSNSAAITAGATNADSWVQITISSASAYNTTTFSVDKTKFTKPVHLTNQILFDTGTTQSATKGIKWSAINSKNPYIGYATDQTDGTFVVGSLLGTNYASGLAIGGGSGNLLWKGARVATATDLASYSLTSHTHSYLPLSGGILTGGLTIASGGLTINAGGFTAMTDGGSVITLDGATFRSGAADSVNLGTTTFPWYQVVTNRLYVTQGRIQCKPIYDNTVSSATNMYVNSSGTISRTTNTSSRTIKHDIKELSNEDLVAENLYDLGVFQFKYNDEIITDMTDVRYGKDLVGFIIEDMNEVYPIAVDKPTDDVKEWTWNAQYLIPPMLKLIQDQHEEDIRMASEIEIVKAKLDNVQTKLDAAMIKIAEQEKEIKQLKLAS